MKFVLGVDEAGRGPLAGPVAVGVVAVPSGFDVLSEFPGVKDSKQLTELARERLFNLLEIRKDRGDLRFGVTYGTHEAIDAQGITLTVKQAVQRNILDIAAYDSVECVYLDGLLHAPQEYAQETIIHGDDLIPVISLASIAAKVSRDRLMERYGKEFPVYGFEKHKGYPTKMHYEMLARYGPCTIHRRSYLHFTEASEMV